MVLGSDVLYIKVASGLGAGIVLGGRLRRVLSDAGRTVGRALADLANSLNPELVAVGGSLGPSRSLVDGVRASIDRYAQPDTAAVVRVVAIARVTSPA